MIAFYITALDLLWMVTSNGFCTALDQLSIVTSNGSINCPRPTLDSNVERLHQLPSTYCFTVTSNGTADSPTK